MSDFPFDNNDQSDMGETLPQSGVTPSPEATRVTDSQSMTDAGIYGNYSWYQRLIQGSGSRLTRYREYDLMDNDVDVARALDTIAEEMTGNELI